jgi:hypothetical protein
MLTTKFMRLERSRIRRLRLADFRPLTSSPRSSRLTALPLTISSVQADNEE